MRAVVVGGEDLRGKRETTEAFRDDVSVAAVVSCSLVKLALIKS